MDNFENISLPELPKEPAHEIKEEAFFVRSEQAPAGATAATDKKLAIATKVIVIEECTGYKGKWAKIKIQDVDGKYNISGYILQSKIKPVKNTTISISCNLEDKFLPNPNSQQINWRDQSTNVVFLDSFRGVYSVLYDTGIEKIEGKTDQEKKKFVQDLMKNALIESLISIFKDSGKRSDKEYVTRIQNRYYLFARAEAIDFSLRNCSTLRVLVSLPIRYCESSEIEKSATDTVADPTAGGFAAGETTGASAAPDSSREQTDQNRQRYIDIPFNNYEEYDEFFNDISNIAGVLDVANIIFKSREWDLEPRNVRVNFVTEGTDIKDLKDQIDLLILSNIPSNLVLEALEFNQLKTSTWQGNLTIKLDRLDKKIAYMEFKTKKGQKIPLNIGVLKFLENEKVKSKTSINYLLERHYSRVKKEFHQKLYDFFQNVEAPTENQIKAKISELKVNDEKIKSYQTCFDVKRAKNDRFTVIQEIEKIKVKDEPVDEFYTQISSLNIFNYESDMEAFLTKYHEPQITSAKTKPLDLTNCVKSNYQVSKQLVKNKTPSIVRELKRLREQDKKQQRKREGGVVDDLIGNFPNNIKNRNIRIIMGLEKPVSGTPIQQLNRYVIPAFKEIQINGLLAEILKCSTMNLDPATFADLLDKYNKAKALLEQAALATLCNPFLTVGLKKLNGFSLPSLPVYNPNKNLADELTSAIINAIKEIIVATTRKIIEEAVKNCLKDKNKEKLPGAEDALDDLADALENSANDPNINDAIDSAFGLGKYGLDSSTNDATDEALEADRANAKLKLKNVLDGLLCVLTTKELCDLLRGNTCEADTYEIIRNVFRVREPSIANKFSSQEDIKSFFSKMGLSVDLSICTDIDNATGPIPANPLCDDGTLNNARRKLLDDKGLTPDLIDSILNDIKNQEKKNVEDILKFLDSDQPFDLSKVPSVLCKKAPDGTIIPPTVNISPPLDSFKSLLDTLFASVYDTFDVEATSWSGTTYSYSSSAPQLLKFDESTGKILVDKAASDALTNQDPTKSESTKEILPAYLFNQFLIEKSYTSKQNFTFSADIDGYKQQQLDSNIIQQELIIKTNKANDSLKEFINYFMRLLIDASLIGAVNTAFNAATSRQNTLSNIENRTEEVFRKLALFDSFVRDNSESLNNAQYSSNNEAQRKFLEKFGPNQEATSLVLQETGAAVYLKIMEFISSKTSELNGVFSEIDKAFGGNGNGPINTQLTNYRKAALDDYAVVKKYYKAVLNATLNYPKFTIQFKENILPNNPIPLNTDLHDKFTLNILKNSSTAKYITISDYEDADESVSTYVKQQLNISQLNPDKQELFSKFVYKLDKNVNINNAKNDFNIAVENSLLCIGEKIRKDSSFLGKVLITSGSSQKVVDKDKKPVKTERGDDKINKFPASYKAITDYLTLVLPDSPTPQQKACKVRPHYLDIDSVINDAVKKKESSLCADVIINEKIRNNESINSEDLEKQETNDTQNIMLSAAYSLALRIYAHDIILRGIGPFGIFDPQILRNDALFVDFLANLIESEMRGVDNRFFNLMTGFFLKQYNFSNPDDIKKDNEINRRQILKKVLRDELRKAILPKLSKRILDDTNKALVKFGDTTKNIQFKLAFIDNGQALKQILNFNNQGKSIEILEESNTVKLKINGNKYTVYNGKLKDFDYSKPEFKLLFEFIFPIKRYVTLFFITNVLSTSTRKQILDAFRGTKKNIRKIALLMQTNGQPVVPSLNNPQDVLGADSDDDLLWFIIKTIFTTPIKIAKGLIEGIDPNVALSSGIYKVGKTFEPELTSFLIPAIGVPLGFWIFSPFMFNPFNIIYYALGLWYEDGNSNGQNKAEEQKRKYIEDLLNNTGINASIDCEDALQHSDVVKFDNFGYYVNSSFSVTGSVAHKTT